MLGVTCTHEGDESLMLHRHHETHLLKSILGVRGSVTVRIRDVDRHEALTSLSSHTWFPLISPVGNALFIATLRSLLRSLPLHTSPSN